MLRRLLFVLVPFAATGCATFRSMSTLDADSTRAVWVAKSTTMFGWQLSDEAVLFCTAPDIKKPVCTRATGNVTADVAITKQQ